MPDDRRIRFYPQEILFGIFLAGVSAWLLVVRGPGEPFAWMFAGLLGIGTVIVRRAHERVRLFYCGVIMLATYPALGHVIPMLNPHFTDAALQRADAAIFGTQPALLLQPLVRPWLTEIFHACYFLYYPWVAAAILGYGVGDLAVFRRLCAGTFTIYGLGIILYTIFPATGPVFHSSFAGKFTVPLDGYLFTALNDVVVEYGCNRVDAFPSIHCALTGYLLFFEMRQNPARFRLLILPTAGLWFATVYLRYHYFADVLAGAAVSFAGFLASRRYLERPR